jgi:cyclophilin family peptidyl-prolyl cis-trans isomerase
MVGATLKVDHKSGEVFGGNLRSVKPSEKKPTSNIEPRQIKLSHPGCQRDLSAENSVHMVPPPAGPVSVVCCDTSEGPLSIAVHHAWAPIGAQRFMDMVRDGFFGGNPGVSLFRALKAFLVQFGLHGDPSVQAKWHRKGNLIDDPSWLPLGPENRERNGIKRFRRGYMAYAGAGKNSRGTQLILAFQDNGPLCGGSPWEVPFGQIYGESSFQSLDRIYTGYGEKVSQGKIQNRGQEYLESNFPKLSYINVCNVVIDRQPHRVENNTTFKNRRSHN